MKVRIEKKKIIVVLLLTISLLIALSGCGSETQANTAQTTEDKVIRGKIDVEYTNGDLNGSWDDSEAIQVSLNESYAITEAGTYVLSGTLSNGQITVKVSDQEKVKIVLNNAIINSDDGPGILVENADKVFITLAEGSVNSLSDSATYTSTEDQPWGAIFSKSDLTINGSGKLTVEGNSNNGIVSKDDLRITGGTIAVTAKTNGIKGKDSVGIYDGNITIAAQNDGIKSNDTASDKGYVSIDGGKVKITDVTSQGIQAQNIAQINGGSLDINSNNEGIQGKVVYVSAGEINIQAKDDGLNATDGSTTQAPMDAAQEDVYIEIEGGEVNVSAEADGLDSNGDLTVSGGTTIIQGPENGGNGSLDYQGEGTISGGTFITVGNGQMAQNFGENSKQCAIMYNGDVNNAKTEITLSDADGKEIATIKSKISFSSVIISSSKISKDNTYTLKLGDSAETIEMSSTVVSYGNSTMGRGMGGGKPSGGIGGERPDSLPN